MNKKLIATGLVASILTAGGVAGAAWAETKAGSPALTATQAIEIALAEVPGEVQEAELETEDGSQVYEIEILNAEGVEMEVEIDAETGMILEIEAEDDDDGDGDDADDDDEQDT